LSAVFAGSVGASTVSNTTIASRGTPAARYAPVVMLLPPPGRPGVAKLKSTTVPTKTASAWGPIKVPVIAAMNRSFAVEVIVRFILKTATLVGSTISLVAS
jgi:hypothetical protein